MHFIAFPTTVSSNKFSKFKGSWLLDDSGSSDPEVDETKLFVSGTE